ncbi:MAG: hypothetical protein ACRECO_13730 [Xanthobacteraceae bacterium]
MPTIYENIETTLARADEILAELLQEYDNSLHKKEVTPKAKQLTHDICVQLRSALDRTARRYWEKYVSPHLSEADNEKADVYFPVASHAAAMDSTLGRWRWKAVRSNHQPVYDYLRAQQPFSADKNKWLAIVADLAVQGKHIDLVPQRRFEQQRIVVQGAAGGASWNPANVRFGGGSGSVRIMGAPIDPETQRIIPTQGVTERIETWISFVIDAHNVNAAGFCKEACKETRRIVQEMTDHFVLS